MFVISVLVNVLVSCGFVPADRIEQVSFSWITSFSTMQIMMASVADHAASDEEQLCAVDDAVFDQEQLSSILDISLIVGHGQYQVHFLQQKFEFAHVDFDMTSLLQSHLDAF